MPAHLALGVAAATVPAVGCKSFASLFKGCGGHGGRAPVSPRSGETRSRAPQGGEFSRRYATRKEGDALR